MVIVIHCLISSYSAPIHGGRSEFRKPEGIEKGIMAKPCRESSIMSMTLFLNINCLERGFVHVLWLITCYYR
jgi:hypothetical protein